MAQLKRTIEIKYTHHPRRHGGEVDITKQVTDSYFTDVYDNGRRLSDRAAKDIATKQFLDSGIKYLSIGSKRVTKKVEY